MDEILPPRRFRDTYESGSTSDGRPRQGRTAEQEAAAFWLEHRAGPRHQSVNAPERLHLPHGRGRSLPTVDVEHTVGLVERALLTIPVEWRAVTVVSLGWRLGVRRLRDPRPDGAEPYLARAGLSTSLPRGLCRYALRHWAEQFRAALIEVGLADGELADDYDAPPSARAFTVEERVANEGEKPLRGWKAVASFFDGASERTVQSWAEKHGLPVHRPAGPGGVVLAFPSELTRWVEFKKTE